MNVFLRLGLIEIRHTNRELQINQTGIGQSEIFRHCEHIKLNEEFGGEGERVSAQIRLRIEMLLVFLSEIERQRELLHLQHGKFLSGSHLEKFLDLVDTAEHCLSDLETHFQKAP